MLLFFHIPALTKTILVSIIAVFTLVGIMVRPFKLDEARIALGGAALLLLLGLIAPLDALTTLLSDWNIFFFFLGMMTLSAMADAAGLFDWLAAKAAGFSGGNSRRLLLNAKPTIGPKSIGHVARFVLDHAPCPLLLARPVTKQGFPLPR
jgi:arsenical pump membrane protein